MSRAARLWLFAAAVLAFAALYMRAISQLPPLGWYRGPYGDVLNAVAVTERKATDVVTAVNFDYRGFDTLGEEFILFASVLGATLLLRAQRQESERPRREGRAGRPHPPMPGEATKAMMLALTGPLVVFGLYIVLHGQLTPGGGFQGGVILATAPLLVYLAGDLELFKKAASHGLVEVAEAAGAGAFVGIGLAGLAYSGSFLYNMLPLGAKGDVFSAGTIALISAATGLEVAAGFVLLLYGFLEQAVEIDIGGR